MGVAGSSLRRPPGGAWSVLLLVPILAVLLLLPGLAGDSFGQPMPGTGGSTGPALQVAVTWNGVNIDTATSPSSAIATDFATPTVLHFHWASRSPGAPGNAPLPLYTISDARFQYFLFGLPVETRDEVASNATAASSGSFNMSYDPGVYRYLAEGLFAATATLLTPNGSALWSQDFFFRASAPYSVLAVLPILLLLILAYEVYQLATVGRAAAPPPRRVRPNPPLQTAPKAEPAEPPEESPEDPPG